jgi:hypothetical protein
MSNLNVYVPHHVSKEGENTNPFNAEALIEWTRHP